jgi:hypothetical protein
LEWATRLDGEDDVIEFSWAGETARHVGTVVERDLGKPVVSAASAIMWNALRIAGGAQADRGLRPLTRQSALTPAAWRRPATISRRSCTRSSRNCVRRRTVRQGLSQNGTAWIGDDAPLPFSRIEIKLALERCRECCHATCQRIHEKQT